MAGGKFINYAAALEQACDLFNPHDDAAGQGAAGRRPARRAERDLPPQHRLSVPSRNDEQVIEVARLELAPDYFYKAVPVLTPHVYRQANLTNKSKYVLLPGEATMYNGTDFVGRMNMPLVAIGEQFTAGFGADPQLQVQRQMMDKSRETKGGNQVLKYEYRILVSSYKSEPVKRAGVGPPAAGRERDRRRHAWSRPTPEVSKERCTCARSGRTTCCAGTSKVDPTMNGEKAQAVKYEFKLELDKQMIIGNVLTK